MDVPFFVDTEVHLTPFGVFDCGGDIHRDGARLGIGHEPFGAEDPGDFAEDTHHIGSGDDGIEIDLARLDLLDELIEQIQAGKIDFDTVISTPDMMGVLGKVARILGPKGLMPNPKTGTVTMDVTTAVKNAKGGQVNFRVDKKGNIHAGIGKVSFPEEQIKENLIAFLEKINRAKPASAKGRYVRNAALSLTMSPSITLDSSEVMEIK